MSERKKHPPAPLPDSDHHLWRNLTAGVKPIARGDKVTPEPAPLPHPTRLRRAFDAQTRAARARPTPMPTLPLATPPAAPDFDHLSGLDRRKAQKLKRGELPIEGRIDLHGLTREQAWNALRIFLMDAVATHKRCVIVVTGKGQGGAQTGVLRDLMPHWLRAEPIGAHIAAWTPAQPKDGGAGALYVYLKRRRTP